MHSLRCVQNLMERAVTLGIGAGQQAASPALSQLVAQYASLLAAQVRRVLHSHPQSHCKLGAGSVPLLTLASLTPCLLSGQQMHRCH